MQPGPNLPSGDTWTQCERCGQPLLIDPRTGKSEACANCRSAKSKGAFTGGLAVILLLLAAVGILVAVSIGILM